MPLHTEPEVDVDDDKHNPNHRALGEEIQNANSRRNFAICLGNVNALFEVPRHCKYLSKWKENDRFGPKDNGRRSNFNLNFMCGSFT